MILIAGGAGYIGSHANKVLHNSGYESVVYDNLRTGNIEAVKWGQFIEGDLGDISNLALVFENYPIEAVIHFAASAYVGESVIDPEAYYINNVANTLNLLKCMRDYDCKKIIFSSTCATYGNPQEVPIDELHPQVPINPYGQSKLMIERILSDYSKAYDLKYVSLRYFNAAGADPDLDLGECHDPEPHLLPLILEAVKQNTAINIFGTDYDTHDGTAVRDYIHVTDLAEAHLAALKYLLDGGNSDSFNLGNGNGFSVLEVINAVEKVTGKTVIKNMSLRRDGDPSLLVGDARKARSLLNWDPQYSDLDVIVKTAWNWHSRGEW